MQVVRLRNPVSRKNGRPNRKVNEDAEELRQEFLAAEQGNKGFFGTGQKAQMQWIGRLVNALNERMIEVEQGDADDDEAELLSSQKVATAILNLLKAAHFRLREGPDDPGGLSMHTVQRSEGTWDEPAEAALPRNPKPSMPEFFCESCRRWLPLTLCCNSCGRCVRAGCCLCVDGERPDNLDGGTPPSHLSSAKAACAAQETECALAEAVAGHITNASGESATLLRNPGPVMPASSES